MRPPRSRYEGVRRDPDGAIRHSCLVVRICFPSQFAAWLQPEASNVVDRLTVSGTG